MAPTTRSIWATGLFFGAFSFVAAQAQAEDDKPVTILVAKKLIPSGTRLKDPKQYFAQREVPASRVPKGVLTRFDQIEDRRVAREIAEDGTIHVDDVRAQEADGLAAVLPRGTRAVAFKVAPEALASGFVLPGSRIDILGVERVSPEKSVGKTVAANILVLTVDVQSKPGDKDKILASTITVAVAPADALKVVQAMDKGTIIVALRPIGDEK